MGCSYVETRSQNITQKQNPQRSSIKPESPNLKSKNNDEDFNINSMNAQQISKTLSSKSSSLKYKEANQPEQCKKDKRIPVIRPNQKWKQQNLALDQQNNLKQQMYQSSSQIIKQQNPELQLDQIILSVQPLKQSQAHIKQVKINVNCKVEQIAEKRPTIKVNQLIQAIQKQLQCKKSIYQNLVDIKFIIEMLTQFEKGYVNEEFTHQIISMTLQYMKHAINLQNKYDESKSSKLNLNEVCEKQEFIVQFSRKWLRIKTQIYFQNKEALKSLSYIYRHPPSNSQNRKHSHCYLDLKFDFSQWQLVEVSESVKELCRFDMTAFAYLSNYLWKCCMKAETDGKTVRQIQQMLNKRIKYLQQINEPAPNLNSIYNKQQLTRIKSSILQGRNKYKTLDLEKQQKHKRYSLLKQFIQKIIDEAEQNLKDFIRVVKDLCLLQGNHFKYGRKLESMNQIKQLHRIIQKLVQKNYKEEFEKGKNKEEQEADNQKCTWKRIYKQMDEDKSKTIQQYINKEMAHYEKEMIRLFQIQPKSIKFTVSDMIRAKCFFPDVSKINNCAKLIQARIQSLQNRNIKLIQIKNRLQKPTSDVMLKINVGGTICQLLLAIDMNTISNEYNHKFYELDRSTFFTSITWLKQFNHQISQQYFGKMKALIRANNLAKQPYNYKQEITFKKAKDAFIQLKKLLPELNLILSQSKSQSIDLSKYVQELQALSIQSAQCFYIDYKVLDSHLRNGKFSLELKDYNSALEQYKIFYDTVKAQQNQIIKKIKKYKHQIRISEKQKIIVNKFAYSAYMISIIKNEIGLSSHHIQCLLQAELFAELSLKIWSHLSINNISKISDCLHLLGIINKQLKNGDQAIKYYLKSIEVAKQIGKSSLQIAETYNNIGNVYAEQQNYGEAFLNFEMASNIYKQNNKTSNLKAAIVVCNMGNTYYQNQLYGEALKYFNNGLEIIERVGGKNSIYGLETKLSIARLYENQKKFNQAIDSYQQCLDMIEAFKGSDSVQMVNVLQSIAINYYKLKKDEEGDKYLDKLIEIGERYQYRGYLSQSMEQSLTVSKIKMRRDQADSSQIHGDQGINSRIGRFFIQMNNQQ